MSKNNNKKQHNVRKMQHTSRFTPKIREYLAALPNERELELERFMALSSSSPASSSVSVGALSSDAMRSGSRSRCSSGTNVVVATATQDTTTAACAAAMECVRGKNKKTQIINIPIVMETRAGSSNSSTKPTATSVEDLRTPTKGTQTTTPQMQTRKTQTPESALKSHKRLEWDPAADVGYRCERAASVSNISTLERSVLEAAMQPNRSESDLNRLQQQQVITVPHPPPAQPPLASSTFVNSQTMTEPVPSQSSRHESGVTSAASSFDYQHHHQHHNSSRRSSTVATNTTNTSRSSNSSRHTLSAEELLRHVEQQRQEREYTAQLQQALLCNNRRQQNKENQQPQPQTAAPPSSRAKSSASSSVASNASSSSCPPARGDLDLGVDLLCSLVNKRSLSHGQKKQLIRDIAKRLACLDLVANNGSSSNSRAESTRSSRRSKSVSQPKEQQQERQPQEQPVENKSRQQKNTLTHSRQNKATNTSNRSSISIPIERQVTPPAVTDNSAPNPVPVPAPRTRIATPTESPMQLCSYASTSSGASNELVTQKTNLRPKSRNSTDAAELSAMREWLHPLTQSEIDYEEKRAQLRSSLDKERRTQLDWIETEIRRLRMLQNLLNSAAKEANITPSPPTSSRINIPIIVLDENNKPRQPKRPSPPAPPVTPVATPTQPTVVKVTPTASARPQRMLPASPPPPPPPPPPPAPTVSRPQPPTPPNSNPSPPVYRPMQRSKMATPNTLSHSGSSESVCSFVQQRQRQFMAHYQNQQQQRLEQQQQLFKLQQQQHHQQQQLIHRQQQQQLHPTCPMQKSQPHYIQMQYAQEMGNGYGCLEDGAVYYHVVNTQTAQTPAAAAASTKTATTTAAVVATTAATGTSSNSSCTATSSTSSMLCISSEMSIPMGMVNACEATTTTTTTHQYDDVACHQQQLQLHRRIHHHHHHHRLHHSELTSSDEHRSQQEQRQQMLKVRPRGIAYAIQFTSSGDFDSELLSNALSLQDHLQLARPLFCAQSKQRKAILNEMQLLRNERRRELDQLIENSSLETLDRRLKQLPPPVTSRVRIFTTKEMKALTNKRCEYLPEVLAAQNRELEERRRRSNRIMRDVFNKRLQHRVRRGKLSLNHSRTVI